MKHNHSFSLFFRNNLFLFVFALLLVCFYLLEFSLSSLNSQTNIASNFQSEITRKIDEFKTTNQAVKSKILVDSVINWKEIDKLFDEFNLSGYVYYQDSILFWNTQLSEFFINSELNCKSDTLIVRNKEYYLVNYDNCDSLKVLLFTDLSQFLPVTNSGSLPIFHLTQDLSNADFLIYDNEKRAIAGLIFDSENVTGLSGYILLLLIYYSAFICLIVWIFQLYRRYKQHKNSSLALFLLFLLDVIILRGIDYFLAYPSLLKQSFLFRDSLTNIRFFSSIGDIQLNGLLLLTVLILTYTYYKSLKTKLISGKSKIVILLVVSVFLLVSSYSIGYVISESVKGLGYNSLLGIDFFTLSGAAIVFVILVYNAALFLLFKIFEKVFSDFHLPIYITIVLVVVLSILLYLTAYANAELMVITVCFVVLFLLVFKFIKENQSISLVRQLLYVILFAAFTAVILNNDIRYNRDAHQRSSALLLTRENDKLFENIFQSVYPQIVSDTIFAALLQNDNPEEDAINYLKSAYFSELENRFTIQVTLCSKGELLYIQPEGFITECSFYFNNLIESSGKTIADSSLYLIKGETESIYYIGKMNLLAGKSNAYGETVFLEFFSSIVPEGFGYTELLIDTKADSVDLTGYSFAWYQNNELVYKFGNFPYQTNFNSLRKFKDGSFFDINGYRTLKLEVSPEKYFVISRPSQRITEQLVTFSLLFIVFGAFVLFIYFLVYRQAAGSIFALNFRIRLQFFFIGTISLIIILFASITFYFLETNNANRLQTELNEKTQSVIIELQHKLTANESVNSFDEENLYQLLSKFAMVFFSDINLYDLNGNLLASSRPEIFSRGLQSTRINPKAFIELKKENKLYYLTEEKIGKISYYSSYAPLIMGDNQLYGFVNLPYFARQFDVERSYFLMFSTFINLFVILGIIGTLLALLLSKILIRPLSFLQKSLASIQIGKPNTKIEWNNDDEIGLLIREYNTMIDKLEHSTMLLKQSERESAWREVARQIAHEIKNPLTPMKLNVQYLEKSYLENDPKFDEKIKNVSASLVMQIDTLDKVAEMFSDFAKTTSGNFEKVNLLETIQSSVSLFRSHSKVNIRVTAAESDNYNILAFEKDILRVFNNLIKNSIQSIEGKHSGTIEIVLESGNNVINVSIIDNGKGIAESEKTSIFQPYFTTKTGGTGLGLAIVKNIMTEIGGEISFESSAEKGTRFNLIFKRFNRNSI